MSVRGLGLGLGVGLGLGLGLGVRVRVNPNPNPNPNPSPNPNQVAAGEKLSGKMKRELKKLEEAEARRDLGEA